MTRRFCNACMAWLCTLVAPACGGLQAELPCHEAQLRIVEIMVDPVVAPGGEHAWWEVHNVGAEAAALEGLTLAVLVGKRRQAVTLDTPRSLPPGHRWVLGDRASGPPLDHAYGDGLRLSKKRATVRLECGERVVDAVTYGEGGVPAPERGVSLQRAGDCWCLSQALPYDGRNLGAPRRRKPACPAHACNGGTAEQGVATGAS